MIARTSPGPLDPARARYGRWASAYATLAIRLRWLLVALWTGVAVVVALLVPGVVEGGDDLGGLVPRENPAIRTEIRALDTFGFPLSSRTIVVQRDPRGLSAVTQADAVLAAAAVNQRDHAKLGALPVPNTLGLFPSASESGTTVLTYLFMSPRTSFLEQQRAAQRYVDEHLSGPEDNVVGITGSIPARAEQSRLVREALPLMELLTILAVVLLVGLNFRSLLAPGIALVTAGLALFVTIRGAEILGRLAGVSVPSDSSR